MQITVQDQAGNLLQIPIQWVRDKKMQTTRKTYRARRKLIMSDDVAGIRFARRSAGQVKRYAKTQEQRATRLAEYAAESKRLWEQAKADAAALLEAERQAEQAKLDLKPHYQPLLDEMRARMAAMVHPADVAQDRYVNAKLKGVQVYA
jgi:hypothetical protein